jgi:hypothetical protein
MKSIRFLTHLFFLILIITIMLSSCKEETVDSVVAFQTSDYSLDTDSLYDIEIIISIDPPAPVSSNFTILFVTTGGNPGTAFTTIPAITDGKVILPVKAGDSFVSFTVTPVEEGITEDDVEIEFEIFGLEDGFITDGINGVFSNMLIESKKVTERIVYFEDIFGNCALDGNQEFPEEWTEVEVLQNSLNTAHWLCSTYPEPCLSINPFNDGGAEGDGSEIWLISPQINLSEAVQPILNFMVDRRFDTESFQEYDLKISTDYNGSNFEQASWTVFSQAVSAMEANDPGEDDFTSTGDLDISAYSGQTISISWIYYAEGSKLTATILRLANVLVAEQEAQ